MGKTTLSVNGLSPRVRGNLGSALRQDHAQSVNGLSPRVRGNLGSSLGTILLNHWVYPRACGGTGAAPKSAAKPEGLSPRVRGNRSSRVLLGPSLRSIPARAGEALRRPGVGLLLRVYPRACGGTIADNAHYRILNQSQGETCRGIG